MGQECQSAGLFFGWTVLEHTADFCDSKAEAPKEWNMGTMMLRYQVDPALLGWDDDMEDWAGVDESL